MTAGLDWHCAALDDSTIIDANYRNTQNVRRYFKSKLGDHFTMTRTFMAWMREHEGETLATACTVWKKMKEPKS